MDDDDDFALNLVTAPRVTAAPKASSSSSSSSSFSSRNGTKNSSASSAASSSSLSGKANVVIGSSPLEAEAQARSTGNGGQVNVSNAALALGKTGIGGSMPVKKNSNQQKLKMNQNQKQHTSRRDHVKVAPSKTPVIVPVQAPAAFQHDNHHTHHHQQLQQQPRAVEVTGHTVAYHRTTVMMNANNTSTTTPRHTLTPTPTSDGGGSNKNRNSSAATITAPKSAFKILPYDMDTVSPETLAASASENQQQQYYENELLSSTGSSSSPAGAAITAFTALGLDARLVSKLTAPRMQQLGSASLSASASASASSVAASYARGAGGSSGAHNSSSSGTNSLTGQQHIASTSGLARGHLRDGFGLTRPTRVQRGMIKPAIEGKSMIVKSETGSGKTLAFVLPIIHGLLKFVKPPPTSTSSASNINNRKHDDVNEEEEAYNDDDDDDSSSDHERTPKMKATTSSSSASSPSSSSLIRGDGGTRAVIISPTRELCAQIFAVITRVLQPFPWIVPCLLAGGEKRKSEKARLRKGCSIVVATPGRLLDHLRTTESFHCNLQTVNWLVLDEADRLLDMGFGSQVRDIVQCLKTRGHAGGKGVASSSTTTTTTTQGTRNQEYPRRQGEAPDTKPVTLLLSATVGPAVRELAQDVLFSDALFMDASIAGAGTNAAAAAVAAAAAAATTIRGADKKRKRNEGEDADDDDENDDDENDNDEDEDERDEDDDNEGEENGKSAIAAAAKSAIKRAAQEQMVFSAPKQLQQTALIVPLKWRLVTLLAIVYQAARRAQARAREVIRAKQQQQQQQQQQQPDDPSASAGVNCKAILFVSTTDGADFHHAILSSILPRLLFGKKRVSQETAETLHSLFPVFRLHGNVPQNERTAVFRAFSACSSGILVATDVAARGLDLPAVDLIVQADAPSETQDYVHRIGRTARRGAKGAAILLIQPHEAPYLDLLRAAGLEITQADTSPALATLGDAEMPLDLVSFLSVSSSSSSHDGVSEHGSNINNNKPQRNNNNDNGSSSTGGHLSMLGFDESMLNISAKKAEAATRQSIYNANSSSSGGGEGKIGTLLKGSTATTSTTTYDKEERNPTTGVSVRLSKLLGFARASRGGAGGSNNGAGSSSSRNKKNNTSNNDGSAAAAPYSLEQIAEAFAVAWQHWLEEYVILGAATAATQVQGAVNALGGVASTLPATSSSFSSLSLSMRVPLLPIARSAFVSFVRAYSTHEKAVRHIFHPRLLHLGHAAKAFGLREQPTVANKASRRDAEAQAAAAAAEKAQLDGAEEGGREQQHTTNTTGRSSSDKYKKSNKFDRPNSSSSTSNKHPPNSSHEADFDGGDEYMDAEGGGRGGRGKEIKKDGAAVEFTNTNIKQKSLASNSNNNSRFVNKSKADNTNSRLNFHKQDEDEDDAANGRKKVTKKMKTLAAAMSEFDA